MVKVLYVETNNMEKEYAPLQEQMNKPAAMQDDNQSFWFM